jgi:hypothetical protein
VILTIRSFDDIEDGSLYPIPAQQPGAWLVEREALDGDRPVSFPATSVHLEEFRSGKFTTLAQAEQINGVLYITDCRAAFACEKYDKGSTWVGFGAAAPVALVATGISKTLAARRGKGKLLCGQIRWQWLGWVAGQSSPSFGGTNKIMFACESKSDAGTRTYKLTFTFKRGSVDPISMARDIIHRAATYRLDHDPTLSEDELVKLHALAENPQGKEQSKGRSKMSMYHMPSNLYVSSDNAYVQAELLAEERHERTGTMTQVLAGLSG